MEDVETQESYIIPQVAMNRNLDNAHQKFIDVLDNMELNDTDIENDERNGTKNDELILSYICSLPEREADIVLTIYTFYVPEKNTPSVLLDSIEEKWGTTRDNIRRILKNFRDKIKEDLKDKIIFRR